eukprot:15440953-Alexandrium_andersonii.AAC.1
MPRSVPAHLGSSRAAATPRHQKSMAPRSGASLNSGRWLSQDLSPGGVSRQPFRRFPSPRRSEGLKRPHGFSYALGVTGSIGSLGPRRPLGLLGALGAIGACAQVNVVLSIILFGARWLGITLASL